MAELARKNEEQNRTMAILQQQVQFLVESDLRRTSAIKIAKRQISCHVNDFVIDDGLFEDGQSLMEGVEDSEHHGDSDSPILRCDEVDLEEVLALIEEYFTLPPLVAFLVPHTTVTKESCRLDTFCFSVICTCTLTHGVCFNNRFMIVDDSALPDTL